jgi:glycerol dehydrogenase-like iron-containing ADH family enzyme
MLKMAEHLFNTIYGRNLIGELANIVQKPCLVVTMEDIWDIFKSNFSDGFIVKFVKTLEFDKMVKEVDELPRFEAVVGLGGGQALDYAKIASWKAHMPLYQVPTAISTNAAWGQRAGVRFGGVVKYVGFAEPLVVYIDYDVIRNGPKSLNRSGVCDVLCYHNSGFDWKYAWDHGKCESKWPYEEYMVKRVNEVKQTVIDAIDDIYALNEKGIKTLTEALRWGGATYHNYGWNPRHIEGTDHFLFYTLEYMTKKKFIHGQPVCLGIVEGACMQNNDPDGILDVIYRAGVDIRPEAMNLTWDEVFAAMKYEREYVVKAGYWYTIANDFVVTDEFCNMFKDKIVTKYKNFKA